MKKIISLSSRNPQLREKKCINYKAMTRQLKYGKNEQNVMGLVEGTILTGLQNY